MKARASFLTLIAFLLGSFANAADSSPLLEFDFPGSQLWNPNLPTLELFSADLSSMYSEILTHGRLGYADWQGDDGEHRAFAVSLVFVVPNKLPGFQTMDEAAFADVRIRLSHHGQDYAECTFEHRPVVSRSFAYFDVELEAINGQVKERVGTCDINLMEDGVQAGIPAIEEGVYAHAMVTDQFAHEFEFVEGWCQCDTP